MRLSVFSEESEETKNGSWSCLVGVIGNEVEEIRIQMMADTAQEEGQ
jgi:hypothetical protein